MPFRKETLEREIFVLEASIGTVNHQISALANHVSSLQLKTWRNYRASLNKKLTAIKAKYKQYYGKTSVTRTATH